MFLRTTFTVPAGWEQRRLILSTETAHYKIKVWLNGSYVGDHLSFIEPLEMDLTDHVKSGANTLVVYTGAQSLYGERRYAGGARGIREIWALMGDVYLKSVPQVYVKDVWVIPRWRDAVIEVRAWFVNTTRRKCQITLNHKALLSGAERFDCGSRTLELKPGGRAEVRIEKPWIDPLPWEIGGKYGDPTLYQLASTITAAGAVIDQCFTRFGFREFWKTRFDYFLNGRRIFVQGDVLARHQPSYTRTWYMLLFTLLRENENELDRLRL